MPFDKTKDETIKNYLETYFLTGKILNEETLKRYIREAKNRFPEWIYFMETTNKIRNKYSAEEIKQLAEGTRIIPTRNKKIEFNGEKFKFAHITDTHMGSIAFKQDIWDAIVKKINDEKVDAVFHTGDIVEGMNNARIDMVYDCTHIGYKNQKDYAIDNLLKLDSDIYAVSGNHDRWYIKSAGAHIVEDIAESVPNMHFMGEDVADISLSNNDRPIKIRLWHGEDSSSYATSYRIQKIVESLSGGDKPHVLLCGHTHKQLYMLERNIHCVSGGAVCVQSNWMRSKRLANHTGFWIVEIEYNDRGITRFKPEFYPFYE